LTMSFVELDGCDLRIRQPGEDTAVDINVKCERSVQ
jgi:hypothetical protein